MDSELYYDYCRLQYIITRHCSVHISGCASAAVRGYWLCVYTARNDSSIVHINILYCINIYTPKRGIGICIPGTGHIMSYTYLILVGYSTI